MYACYFLSHFSLCRYDASRFSNPSILVQFSSGCIGAFYRHMLVTWEVSYLTRFKAEYWWIVHLQNTDGITCRFISGIKLWTNTIKGTLGNFCIYCGLSFERGLFHRQDRERIFGLAAAFAVTLKRSLRKEKNYEDLKSMLSEQDLNDLKDADDPPEYCLYQLNGYIVEAMKMEDLSLPGPFYTMMMNFLQVLAECQSEAFRIQKYKVAYGKHMSSPCS